ncbi:hypothetical protein JCM6882_006556 [Rhodosporidiobolus microsporus]
MVLAVGAAAAVLVVLHSLLPHDSSLRLPTSRVSQWALSSTSSTSSASLGASHSLPVETAALPLVSSIASFSLTSPSSNATVAICAVPTHEEQYLPEWITWHRLLGVERFFLFDNAPSLEMRRLLRPWIEEGSVVLYEIQYDETVNIGTIYQQHVLRLCEKYILPTVKWASHHDVDEFLMVDAPGWAPLVPVPASSIPPPPPPSSPEELPHPGPLNPAAEWNYPLHQRFNELLWDATCVPMLRLPFQNYGVQKMEREEMVTERQTVRDNVPPNYHTYGKSFLHSDGEFQRAGWLGPHSCKQFKGTVLLNAHGQDIVVERGTYPYAGLPLPQEGLYLNHYIQRSLHDCYSKFRVLASTPQDWRAKDGLAGCARNYVPTDEELSSPSSRAALASQPQGEELASRPESWSELMMRDTRALQSWQGRMTRAVLDEWRRKGGKQDDGRWFWELGEGADEARLMNLPGVVEISRVEEHIKGMR